jgi:hypothetical protein
MPPPPSPTVEAIYRAYEDDAGDGWRPHLGASQIGAECERALWYTFRWASRARHTGRLLRLFERGQLEEERLVANLRRIGVNVYQHCPETGDQYTVSACDGHFGGSMDAVLIGMLEAPKTAHVCEMKTHNTKSFNDLKKKGLAASKPQHLAQLQTYMCLADFERGVYLAVCKDTDELYLERVYPDPVLAARLMEKAERIITAPRPPEGVSTDPTHWQCKMCQHARTCHDREDVPRNCRTCLHSSPVASGAWACALWDRLIPLETQKLGCSNHRFVPDLVAGEVTDVEGDGGAAVVIYRMKDGETWRDRGPDS